LKSTGTGMSKFDKTGKAAARSAAPRKKKSAGGTLLGVFIGLVIGVLIAFGVVWYLNKSPLPFQNKYEGAPKADKPAAGAGAPAPLPGKPGDKPAERRFDFYNILEGKPAQGGMAPAGAPATTPAPASATPEAPAAEAKPLPSDVFYLQVGAFQKAADADNLKAKLALTGLYASVQESYSGKGSCIACAFVPSAIPVGDCCSSGVQARSSSRRNRWQLTAPVRFCSAARHAAVVAWLGPAAVPDPACPASVPHRCFLTGASAASAMLARHYAATVPRSASRGAGRSWRPLPWSFPAATLVTRSTWPTRRRCARRRRISWPEVRPTSSSPMPAYRWGRWRTRPMTWPPCAACSRPTWPAWRRPSSPSSPP
jgi:hypothetical protein